ncbi:uncharacterized protein [Magallana gigas]|uniref:uncharacterized protein n=1 Tax=Magallana gigas TaxID=29159 RepID=UPI0033421DF6
MERPSGLQKLDITRHYDHKRDQVSRLKSERELLRSEVKSLKDVMNEKERNRDTEKVTERRSQRHLERERDDQKMKMVMMCSHCLDSNHVCAEKMSRDKLFDSNDIQNSKCKGHIASLPIIIDFVFVLSIENV